MSNSCKIYATMLLHRIEQKTLPIRPREVAQKIDISIRETDAGNRYDGYLLKCDDSFGIMINKAIKYETRKNFTIAHEIGHVEIPHHKDTEYKCLKADIGIASVQRQQEREANEFAAELLMPTPFVSEQAKKREIGFEVIKSIAEKCETSLTSSALRYMKYCPEIAAVVVSEDTKIKYFALSEEMKERKFFLSSRVPVSKASIAYYFFEKDGTVSCRNEDKQQVDVSTWFPELDYDHYDCFEHAVALHSFNQVISVVWLIEKHEREKDNIFYGFHTKRGKVY